MRELLRIALAARGLAVTALAAAVLMTGGFVALSVFGSLLPPLPTLPWWAYWMPWVLFAASYAIGWLLNRKRDD